MRDLSHYCDLGFEGIVGGKVTVWSYCRGLWRSIQLHTTADPICNTVWGRQKYGRGGCQHILLWRGHTCWLSSTTCLTWVIDEYKVCNGVCSHLSAEKMTQQIHLQCHPQVLIMRTIFCSTNWVRDRFVLFTWVCCRICRDLTDSISGKCSCTGSLFLFEQLLTVHEEAVVGAFLRLPLPAVAWQGDTDSSWAGECCRQSSAMTKTLPECAYGATVQKYRVCSGADVLILKLCVGAHYHPFLYSYYFWLLFQSPRKCDHTLSNLRLKELAAECGGSDDSTCCTIK